MDANQLAPTPPRKRTTEVEGALGAYFRFQARLSRICLQIAVFGLNVILCAVLYQIWGRYVMNNSPTWTEILALVVVLYVTCLAAAVGVRDGRHIGMESILAYAPERVKIWADITVYLGMIAFGGFMAYGAAILTDAMWDYINPGLPISQGWSYVPLVLGGILIIVFAIERIVARLNNLEIVPSWH
ncbi:MAG: TRAP transporter small permease [Ancalomicrobiaceae bacterium]|nr:TRAP transporter small permease [Ancalomicrobiaceae bacterium]